MVPFEQDVVNFLKQILEALGFIHERNIAHMDLKVGVKSKASVVMAVICAISGYGVRMLFV